MEKETEAKPLTPLQRAAKREACRVEILLERDAKDRDREERRRLAEQAMESGYRVNTEDLVVPPTPEWEKQGESIPYHAKMNNWQDRTVTTRRRRMQSTVTALFRNGKICEKRLAAIKTYIGAYESSGLDANYATTQYEAVGGRSDPAYGSMPRTAWQVQMRKLFRKLNEAIEPRMLDCFDMIVLRDVSVDEAARQCRIRKSTASNIVKMGAWQLHMAIEAMSDTPDIENC